MKTGHTEQSAKHYSKPNTELDPFRKSQLKESQIVMAGVCCSRHLQCIHNQNSVTVYKESDSLSVDSELLKQVIPQQVNTQPWFEYQTKPQIQMLAQVNIKKKQYQKLIEVYQREEKEKHTKQMVQKVIEDAKKALGKSKKVEIAHQKDWGHAIFIYNFINEDTKDNKQKNQQPVKQEKKIQLKPINQRIAQYKQKELLKIKSEQNFHRKTREDLRIQQCKQKIQKNAQQILKQMRLQKEKKEEQKRIIEAKIRAIQLSSLKNVQNCKKKPLDSNAQFNLGDSQYSTFQARAQNRKMLKKEKRPKVSANNPNLIQTSKSKISKYAPKRSKKYQQKKKIVQQKKPQDKKIDGPNQNIKANIDLPKGPFFIWNMPITQEDQHKLQQKSKDVFMNVDRFNYKTGKTFREEANEFLAKKMEKKMQEQMEQHKRQAFLDKVAQKKDTLLRQYTKQQNQIMMEAVWNEDEVFKPNLLQNFRFFAKEKAK